MSSLDRERQRPHRPDGDDDNAGGNLAQLRDDAARMANAANAAIERALSGDSQAFIESVRQRGGQ